MAKMTLIHGKLGGGTKPGKQPFKSVSLWVLGSELHLLGGRRKGIELYLATYYTGLEPEKVSLHPSLHVCGPCHGSVESAVPITCSVPVPWLYVKVFVCVHMPTCHPKPT